MPPAFHVDKAVVVDFGLHGAHLPRQRALSKDKVQFRQNPLIFKQRTRLTGYGVGKLRQYLFDFGLFFPHQAAQIVVDLDNRHRLDKERRAAGGLVVHNARHLRTIFRAHRQHIAPLPHGDERVLQILGHRFGMQIAVQSIADALVGGANFAAHRSQRGAGTVRNFIFRKDRAENFVFQIAHREQRARQIRNVRRFALLFLFVDEHPPHGARGLHQACALQKLLGRQNTAHAGAPNRGADVVKGRNRLYAGARHNRRGLFGFGLQALHGGKVALRHKGRASLLAHLRGSLFHQHFPDLVKLQDSQ